jgi:PhzF family phenazine biosynthesis protein
LSNFKNALFIIVPMKTKLYQVDAFTSRLFGGNPAAVCILGQWLDDSLMQRIAAENNLSETAFAVRQGDGYGIRWFTPESEVDLCGHATLATAHVLFEHYAFPGRKIIFHTRTSGRLAVMKEDGSLTLDFPSDTLERAKAPPKLVESIGREPAEIYRGRTDYLLIYEAQGDIEAISPDYRQLAVLDLRGIIVSAQGIDTDFVSRFFAPGLGINEDPVTGSAHTTLTPYWAARLGKNSLTARQLSARKGELKCRLLGDRVHITGKAVTYLVGEIEF